MYWRIARHLEECEGRIFEEKPAKRQKQVKSLTEEQKGLIQERIADLEERITSLQSCSVIQRPASPVPSSLSISVEEDVAIEPCQLSIQSAIEESLRSDIVVDIQIVHPSFLKAKVCMGDLH